MRSSYSTAYYLRRRTFYRSWAETRAWAPTDGHLLYRHPHIHRQRHHVGQWPISEKNMERWNEVIRILVPTHQPLDRDDLASSARWMDTEAHQAQAQQFIHTRQQWFHALQWIHKHPYWLGEHKQMKQKIDLVVHYLHNENQPIPDDLPLYGLLDNAILMHELRAVFAQLLNDAFDFYSYCHRIGKSVDQVDPHHWRTIRQWERNRLQHAPPFVAAMSLPIFITVG